jgi:hypothetical protein
MNPGVTLPPLVSVCSEIGRGHPSYLDSVLAALARLPGLGHNPQSAKDCGCVPRHTVPELCAGTSGLAWKLAGTAYRFGAWGGVATWLYNHLRSPDAGPSGLQLSLLGSDLRRQFAGYSGICLVDHPLLAHILAPVCRVAYVHGEIAAPGVSAVPGAWRTLVPLESTAARLQTLGISRDALCVTGLLVEPELVAVAETSYQARLRRLDSDRPLMVGLFLSGARPRPHANSMLTCVESLARSGHSSVLLWGAGMMRAAKVRFELGRRGVPDAAARVVWSRSRQDETTRTAELLPSLDVMVAAAHERTNWALGLGLPMFALLPHIGPFAPENFQFAAQQGVCLPLGPVEARTLGPTLDTLRRDGRLTQMARAGWGRHAVTGAHEAARTLAAEIPKP